MELLSCLHYLLLCRTPAALAPYCLGGIHEADLPEASMQKRVCHDCMTQLPTIIAYSSAGCQQPQQPIAWEPTMERVVWQLPSSRGAARRKCRWDGNASCHASAGCSAAAITGKHAIWACGALWAAARTGEGRDWWAGQHSSAAGHAPAQHTPAGDPYRCARATLGSSTTCLMLVSKYFS